jgi:hypothetical protein
MGCDLRWIYRIHDKALGEAERLLRTKRLFAKAFVMRK